MVKIETIKSYTPSRLKKNHKKSAANIFQVNAENSSSGVESVAVPQSPGEIESLSQLMQIQEIKGQAQEAKCAFTGGEAILESLEKLQNEILVGAISKTSLKNIVNMTNALPAHIENAKIKQVLAEIKQRAMIELAKIEMGERGSVASV